MNKNTKYNVAHMNINISEDIIKREKPVASQITPKTYDKSYISAISKNRVRMYSTQTNKFEAESKPQQLKSNSSSTDKLDKQCDKLLIEPEQWGSTKEIRVNWDTEQFKHSWIVNFIIQKWFYLAYLYLSHKPYIFMWSIGNFVEVYK